MTLPVRPCIGCERHDDHPRHVVVLADGTDVPWHMDCHALATGCTVCTSQTASADGAKGDELRNHLTTKDA